MSGTCIHGKERLTRLAVVELPTAFFENMSWLAASPSPTHGTVGWIFSWRLVLVAHISVRFAFPVPH
jgi:hypothetical protein